MARTMDYGGQNTRALLTRVLVAVLLIAIGFAVGRWSAPDSVEPSEPPATGPDAGPAAGTGPSTLKEGVPVGYARTEEGALQASINYTRALVPDPAESKESYAAKLRAIASDQWGEELQSTIDSWREGEAEVAPLRFRVTEFSIDRAEVGLWFASYVNPRNGSPGAVWGRTFLTLVWENDDWKVAGEDGDAGPWPAPLARPSASIEFSQQLAGFESLAYEPASLP